MEQSQTKRSLKTLRPEKKPSRDRFITPEQQSTSAAAAAQSAFGYAFPGVPGEYLLAAGNQFLLNLSARAEPETPVPELRFSEVAPANSFEPAETAEHQLPEFSGRLLSLNDFGGISGGF